MSVISRIGSQRARVVSHVLGKSGTGTPHVAVLFENEEGDRITWYGYLTDKTLERTVESLQILGWDPAAHGGRIEVLNGTDLLQGAEAEIVVDVEDYEGKPTPKVRWVNRIGGGLQAMDDADAAAFSATLRQKIMSAAKPVPNAKPGPSKKAAAAVAGTAGLGPDDDLPF